MIALHLIFCMYGHWLPNDPRGSWSQYLRNQKLHEYGEIVPANTTQSLARQAHDVAQRLAAKEALQYEPVIITGIQALAISKGFAQAIQESGYAVFACAIMPDHVHLVVANHKQGPKTIVKHFKSRGTHWLNRENCHPAIPSVWSRGGWAVFLDSEDDCFSAIEYVNQNPIEKGLKPQNWSFVVPFR